MYAHSSGSYTFPDGYLHNGYLIFIEVLSIRNSLCAINSRVNPKNIADSKQKHMWVKVEAGIFGGGIGLHFCREPRKSGCHIIVSGEPGERAMNWGDCLSQELYKFHRNCTNFQNGYVEAL